MARGWESKSVEAQQAEAGDKQQSSRVRMNPRQAARWREAEGLRLAQANLVQQIAKSHDPRHRQMLEESKRELERKLRALTSE